MSGVEAVAGDVVGPATPDGERAERWRGAAGFLPENVDRRGDAASGGAVGAIVFEVDGRSSSVVLADPRMPSRRAKAWW